MIRPVALVLAALVLFAGRAHATELSESLSPDGKMAVAQKLAADRRHDLAMRNAGIVLTVAGVVGTAVGITYTILSVADEDNRTANRDYAIGLGTLIGGQAAVGVGVPLWVVGQVRANKAQRARLDLSAGGARLTF